MIITCPDCQSKYVVPASNIGAGRKVRCSKCEAEWFQSGTVEAAPSLPGSAKPSASSKELEKKIENIEKVAKEGKKALWVSLTSAVFIIFALLGAFIMLKDPLVDAFPQMQGVYYPFFKDDVLSEEEIRGLEIINIERDIKEETGHTLLIFKGDVLNKDTMTRQVPNIKISLLNEYGVVLDYWTVQPELKTIKAGEKTSWVCYFSNPELEKLSEYKAVFVKRK